MLKCTVVLWQDSGYFERKPFKTPVLPLVGQMITYGDDTYQVENIEYVSNTSGEVTDIKIRVVSA